MKACKRDAYACKHDFKADKKSRKESLILDRKN